jgi:hypothetical protein
MTLTQSQIESLTSYAEKHGKSWKSKLITSWSRGGNHGPDLQEVRNQFGTSWLASFKFPR